MSACRCGGGSSGLATAIFPILKGETVVDIRLLVVSSASCSLTFVRCTCMNKQATGLNLGWQQPGDDLTPVPHPISQDRSIVEAFIMGGRVVFSKVYSPALLYLPDTHVALQAWGAAVTADIDVHS